MAQIELLFLLVFPLSAFSTHAINPTAPSPKNTPTLNPSDPLASPSFQHSASPSHARHIQSWHSLVALFCFFFLLSSLPAALVLAHLCSFISLLSLFCRANMHDYSHPLLFSSTTLCVLSLLLGHQNQSDSRRSCVLHLCLLPPLFSLPFLSVPQFDKCSVWASERYSIFWSLVISSISLLLLNVPLPRYGKPGQPSLFV